MAGTHAGLVGIPFVVASFALAIGHRWMPARTGKGSAALDQAVGFKQYIATAEADRMKFAEEENIFAKYLPYAIVFGETTRWAKAFEGMYAEGQQPPGHGLVSPVRNVECVPLRELLVVDEQLHHTNIRNDCVDTGIVGQQRLQRRRRFLGRRRRWRRRRRLVMAGKLDGQQALITGGGSGLGLATAQALARDGAIVTICGRTQYKLDAALKSLPANARSAVCDVRDESSVKAAVATAAEGGGLHIAVANAGTGTVGSIVMTELDAWNAVMETNLTGVFLTFKHAGGAIAKAGGGAMVAISSIAGALTHRYMGPYCVSKAAVEMLVKNTADEMGMVGVRVNAVRPGLVPTDLSVGLTTSEFIQNDYLEQMPLGRNGTPRRHRRGGAVPRRTRVVLDDGPDHRRRRRTHASPRP